jgi:DNA topoisomerase-1
MQQIKEKIRSGNDVVSESRGMLHAVFDQLEAHCHEIGNEIMEQTAEELILGPCPVCSRDLRIRHLRNQTQFIGCTNYPECSFNIGLPMAMWGRALRTDSICPLHGLHHVRLVRKGSRPWEIGCPLCHHITTNQETMALIPSMNPGLLKDLHRHHIYTVYELAKTSAEEVSRMTRLSPDASLRLIAGAEEVLTLLRRRSDCRKFVRKHLPPRKGRSQAAVIKKLLEAGIEDIQSLGTVEVTKIRNAGIGEKEAAALQKEAKKISNERILKEIGIPAVSLKRYQAAGIITPDDFLLYHPAYISQKAGISPDTVCRHLDLIGASLDRPVFGRCTRGQIDKGRAELLSVHGLGEASLEKLYRAGIINGATLLAADPEKTAPITGIAADKIREYQDGYRAITTKK